MKISQQILSRLSVLTLLLVLAGSSLFAQLKTQPVFRLNALALDSAIRGSYAVPLDSAWRISTGNLEDTSWIYPGFDDSKWLSAITDVFNDSLLSQRSKGIFFCRLKLVIDSSLRNKTVALILFQLGASDVYINGEPLVSFGRTAPDEKTEERFNPNRVPYIFEFSNRDTLVIAIRYSNHRDWQRVVKEHKDIAGFSLSLGEANNSIAAYTNMMNGGVFYVTFLACLFYTLGFVHFLLFIFHTSKISNLYYSIFSFCVGIIFNLAVNMFSSGDSDATANFSYWSGIIWSIIPVSLLAMLYNLFYKRYPLPFFIFALVYMVIILSVLFRWKFGIYLAMLAGFATCVEMVRIIIWAIWKKKDGAWIVGSGLIGFVFLFVGSFFAVMIFFDGFQNVRWTTASGMVIGLLYFIGVFSIPISMSIYLARDFAVTSKKLARKLQEVEELSAKSIAQEKEKQKYLETQKETLEEQVKERTAELTEQKNLIEEKQKEIIDSIRYAQRIQKALITNDIYIARNLNRLANKKNTGN